MSEELNLNEMEKVNGGTGGSPTPLPPKINRPCPVSPSLMERPGGI